MSDERVAHAPRDDAARRRCAACGRTIEGCAFCQSDRCEIAACYRCVIVDLHQFKPQPHPHGG